MSSLWPLPPSPEFETGQNQSQNFSSGSRHASHKRLLIRRAAETDSSPSLESQISNLESVSVSVLARPIRSRSRLSSFADQSLLFELVLLFLALYFGDVGWRVLDFPSRYPDFSLFDFHFRLNCRRTATVPGQGLLQLKEKERKERTTSTKTPFSGPFLARLLLRSCWLGAFFSWLSGFSLSYWQLGATALHWLAGFLRFCAKKEKYIVHSGKCEQA